MGVLGVQAVRIGACRGQVGPGGGGPGEDGAGGEAVLVRGGGPVGNQYRAETQIIFEKNLADIQSTTKRVGWCEKEKTTKLWKQLEGDEQKATQA